MAETATYIHIHVVVLTFVALGPLSFLAEYACVRIVLRQNRLRPTQTTLLPQRPYAQALSLPTCTAGKAPEQK